MEEFYFSTINTRSICPLSVVSRPLHLQLTTDHGQLTIPVTFSFRVSVGLEVNFLDRIELHRSSIQKIKHSTVSTGNLKTFRFLQLRPINRVVYPGSFGRQAPMESSSWHRLHA